VSPPDDVLAEVLTGQYASLVRLAAMLLDDAHAAEDVVQDAYVRVAARHYRLRDPAKALAYLRQTVVNLARNSLRRRLVARKYAVRDRDPVASAEDDTIRRFQQQVVVRALRSLSRRHREVLGVNYFAGHFTGSGEWLMVGPSSTTYVGYIGHDVAREAAIGAIQAIMHARPDDHGVIYPIPHPVRVTGADQTSLVMEAAGLRMTFVRVGVAFRSQPSPGR
jgi:RNA polymerase sigma factor (sigma-70 family)